MIPRAQTLVLALTLALCLVKAAASPIDGTWEGTRGGAPAATITVTQRDGLLTGSAVFYILHDKGGGTYDGQALPAHPLTAVEWDGKALRFAVEREDGAMVRFELRLTGEGKAVLRTRSTDAHGDESVPMVLRK